MSKITAKIIADSVSEAGVRLTTLQLSYPRYIHAELMTHRVFSRNASSSRAIPVSKLADMALEEMVEPIRWGLNQSGMQAKNECLSGEELEKAKAIWRHMAEVCAQGAKDLSALGLHKQWANRPLEWFSNISVVVTATEWDNFFALRAHKDAQPEIHELALVMQEVMTESLPELLMNGEWHLPYVTREEKDNYHVRDLLKMSAARCARTSYMKHDGTNPDVESDIELHGQLVVRPFTDKRGNVLTLDDPIHASPIEHQATPLLDAVKWSGNFKGWHQYRKVVEAQQ